LDSSLYAGVPGPQGTDSGPQAHLRRSNEIAGGANISFPRLAFLRFYFDNYLSRSLAGQGLKKFSGKNILLIVAPSEALSEVWE
jgi:hypothetical protein